MPSAEYVRGYDDGFGDAEDLRASRFVLQTTAFGLGLVVGMALATVLFLSATSSSGSDPTTPQAGVSGAAGLVRASAPFTASASDQSQRPEPRLVVVIPAGDRHDIKPSGNLPSAGVSG